VIFAAIFLTTAIFKACILCQNLLKAAVYVHSVDKYVNAVCCIACTVLHPLISYVVI
jgi:hypothetical protein